MLTRVRYSHMIQFSRERWQTLARDLHKLRSLSGEVDTACKP